MILTILLLLLALALVFFAQKLLFRRFWDRNLEVRIEFDREYVFCGEDANLTETIVNNKYLPLPVLEVGFDMSRFLAFREEDNSMVSDMTYRRDIFTASFKQRITRTLPFQAKKRGYYRIASTTVSSLDFLMQDKLVTHIPQSTEFYVLPARLPAEQIRIPYSKIMGMLVSRRRVYDDPFEFAGIRDYRRTDPMKHINWKASARNGSLLVNLHESTLSQKVVLLLDCEGAGSASVDTLNEVSISIAAALAARMLQDGISVTILSNGADVLTEKPLCTGELTGRSTALHVRRQLARLVCRKGLLPMETLLRAELERSGKENNLYVLISKEQKQHLLPAFEALAGGHEAVWILPEDRNMPERHKMTETSRHVDIVRWSV